MASLILCAFVDIVHTKIHATIDNIVPIEIHAVVVELRKNLIDDMERSMMSVLVDKLRWMAVRVLGRRLLAKSLGIYVN